MKILEALARYDARATYFVVGRIARDMPRRVKVVAAERHESPPLACKMGVIVLRIAEKTWGRTVRTCIGLTAGASVKLDRLLATVPFCSAIDYVLHYLPSPGPEAK